MEIEYACRVERGRRPYNDDRAMAGGSVASESSVSGSADAPLLAAVCDGCGGYAGGFLAAETVLETLKSRDPGSLMSADALADTLELSRQRVAERQAALPQYRTMCTTVAGCVFSETGTVIFHAGDSRVYRYGGFGLVRVTSDHSAIQDMVDYGVIAEEARRSTAGRNVITRGIGFDCEAPEIYVSKNPIQPGEIWLICSDGLWEYLTESAAESVISEKRPLVDTADALIAKALENGADDNISVCLCAVPGEAGKAEKKPFVLD